MNIVASSNSHLKKVHLIQERIRELYARKIPFKIYHGSTNSTRVLSFKQTNTVNTSSLTNVLEIDVEKRTAIAESNVPMDRLVRHTLKHGLMPKVVTEFPGITVGGGYQGAAAETSSFKYGCFSQTLNWVEVVVADGKLLKISPEKYADLFYGMAGSYGTLGVTTAVEVQLISARRYVNVTHHPVNSFEEAVEVSEKYTRKDVDFIECLMFSETKGSVVTGKLSDEALGRPKRFSRPFDTWYYLYVEKTLEGSSVVQDSIPLKDYLFRYNRGAFWGGKQAFDHFGVKFTAFNRFILDPLMRTRKLYQALQSSAAAQVYICQDIVLPSSTTASFLRYISTNYRMFPTGFCPILSEPKSPLQCNGLEETMLFNVGVYGL